MRGILLLLAGLIGGPALIVTGIGQYKDSKRLLAEAKATTAFVMKGEQTRSRKGRRNYYLTVLFKPEQGDAVTKRVSVGSDLYSQAVNDKVVKVNYLPSDPGIFQLGEKVETRTSSMITGSLLLFAALGVGGYKWFSRSSKDQPAEQLAPSTPAAEEFKKAA
jgi:hypothetical protein